MATIPVYDVEGKKTREVELDPKALDKAVRRPLLKEALLAYLASQRQGSAKTKTRAKVAGGGAKPWRQKGTGRARHGSRRSPIWVGGGNAHGPRPRDFGWRLPAKQRRLALRSALRHRLQESRLSAVEGFDSLEKPRTRKVAGFLDGIGLGGKGALLVSEGHDRNLYLSARNLPKVEVVERRNLNAGQILRRPNLIMSASALDALVEEVKG